MRVLSFFLLLFAILVSCAQPIAPSLELTPTAQTLVTGQTLTLNVKRRFPGGSAEDVTSRVIYSATPRASAVVNERGVVTAGTEPGPVLVTAFDPTSEATADASFTVVASQITSIEVSPSPAIQMTRGTMRPFTAIAHLSNGALRDVTNTVLWSSTNEAAAIVGNSAFDKGIVKAVAAGDTTILATDGTTSVQGRSIVFVAGDTPTLQAIIVTPNPGMVTVAASVQFGALGILSDGTTKDLTRVATWSSSRTDVATVDNLGMVTGVLAGDTTITATGPEPSTAVRGSAAAKVVP